MENVGTSIKGIYRDVLKRNNHIIFDSGWVLNTITDGCRKLLSAFMKNDQSNGIQFLAVGKGSEDWDITGALPPTASETQLVDHDPYLIPKDNLDFAYLNDNSDNDDIVDGPTNRLQIKATLGENEPSTSSYPLREFGLFGPQYPDGSIEYMINCIRHPVIHKDASATLIRVIRLYF